MPVSFGAKLKIDENYGKNVPSYIDKENVETLASQYKTFVDKSKILSTLIPDDTIVLSSKKHSSAFSVDLDIYDKNSDEPFKTTVCVSRGVNKPIFRVQSLMFLTYQYIAFKFDKKPGFFETGFRHVKRAMKELMDEKEKS